MQMGKGRKGPGGRTEDDDSDVYGTQDAEFIRLLEETILALGRRQWILSDRQRLGTQNSHLSREK